MAAAGRPMTAADVLAGLGNVLAYTTVMTTLSRLYDKGVLSRVLIGRAYVYELATTVEGVDSSTTARQMRRLLEGRDDRAGGWRGSSPISTPRTSECWRVCSGKPKKARRDGGLVGPDRGSHPRIGGSSVRPAASAEHERAAADGRCAGDVDRDGHGPRDGRVRRGGPDTGGGPRGWLVQRQSGSESAG